MRHNMPHGCWHSDYDLLGNASSILINVATFVKEFWALQSRFRTKVFLSRWPKLPPQACCRCAKPRGATIEEFILHGLCLS